MIKYSQIYSAMIVCALCSCDIVEKRYVGYNETADLSENDRAWLPSILPENSTDIQLQYDLDTNKAWASFRTNVSSFLTAARKAKIKKIEHLPENYFQRYSHRYSTKYELREPRLIFFKSKNVKKAEYKEYYSIDEKNGLVHYFSEP